ncbi:PREDICTED: uncharacterized protein LOC109325672 isoform X1 [Lupinus angustifolius]|uniref:uncharacterized protein LOC109325672 isoform X1 n=1 Tax=Lupinus angustifolius TaxID=3871 RepID=UPI00092F5ED3|nr:PREDICTED: uncharacterized protein LOC109325672 isoform X1 [Lupinus angustifolius]
MAATLSISISGGSHVNAPKLWLTKRNGFGVAVFPNKSNFTLHSTNRRCSSISAQYRCSDNSGGGGGDFLAGFLLGGAILGTAAYIFAPQIRRSLLNEDEYGFRKAKRPLYHDGGLERTRQTLNKKISQLNSAIDNVSSRLRGGNNVPASKIESDPEVEATM